MSTSPQNPITGTTATANPWNHINTLLWRLQYKRNGIHLGSWCLCLATKTSPILWEGSDTEKCVQSCMLPHSETWSLKKQNQLALLRVKLEWLIRWMHGVKITDRFTHSELSRAGKKLGFLRKKFRLFKYYIL